MGLVTKDNVNEVLAARTPSPEQTEKINELREGAKVFAKIILMNCPDSADKSSALRKVREALSDASASIVLNGMV